jgi:hypothetical protein
MHDKCTTCSLDVEAKIKIALRIQKHWKIIEIAKEQRVVNSCRKLVWA